MEARRGHRTCIHHTSNPQPLAETADGFVQESAYQAISVFINVAHTARPASDKLLQIHYYINTWNKQKLA